MPIRIFQLSAKIEGKEIPVNRKRIAQLVLYGIAASVSLSLLSYGLAWKKFARTPPGVLTSGGRQAEGRITELRTRGFGSGKDYYLRVERSREEFMLPSSIYEPLELDQYLREGARIYIGTTGGETAVILQLSLRPEGEAEQKLLDYHVSAKKYALMVSKAPELGNYYITLGLVIGAVLFLAAKLLLRWSGKRNSLK
jgi:hypothetical protein